MNQQGKSVVIESCDPPSDLIWPMWSWIQLSLKNNRDPLLHPFQVYASFDSHRWIHTWVALRNWSIWRFFASCDLLWMTLKINRVPLLYPCKLYVSFRTSHRCIQIWVTVWKRSNWFLTSVTLTFDLRPWTFAWTSLLSKVITPENFMMIQWQEHCQKGVTERQMDGQLDRQTE